MRIPRWLAWTMLLLGVFTAGLLRQFHDRTPEAPLTHPLAGSLLFAAIFFLLLVTAREHARGAVPGPGVRLGSVTPFLLMLLVEKWVSLGMYPIAFDRIADPAAGEPLLDAQYRGFAGVLLILLCVGLGRLSAPSARKTWRRARPSRWPAAALGGAVVIVGTYVVLGLLAAGLGGGLSLSMRPPDRVWPWVVGGQTLLAFAEELYYRGLLLAEMSRLAPRLGLRDAAARRWAALLVTSLLFAMEHVALDGAASVTARQFVFTLSLGLIFGIIVMVSANVHFAAAIHAWINWLLLGAAPIFVTADGRAALPAGPYIGVTLVLAFVVVLAGSRWRRRWPGPTSAPLNAGGTG